MKQITVKWEEVANPEKRFRSKTLSANIWKESRVREVAKIRCKLKTIKVD